MMGKAIGRFEGLECWQNARNVVNHVDRICNISALKKDYSLIDQMKRAALSIMANIAEGFSRRGNKEFIQFLFIAKSSAAELQSHLYVVLDQGHIEQSVYPEISRSTTNTRYMINPINPINPMNPINPKTRSVECAF